MDEPTTTETGSVELCALSPRVQGGYTLPTATAIANRSTSCDDWSDSEQDFQDAQDYLDVRPTNTVDLVAPPNPNSAGVKRSWRLCSNFNRVLITAGMLVGVAFAYLQYQQQAWSNRVSAVQTCIALEAAGDIVNSSFCNNTIKEVIQNLDSRTTKRSNVTSATLPLSKHLEFVRLSESLFSICLISVFIVVPSTFLLLRHFSPFRIDLNKKTQAGTFAPPIHVLNELPRFVLYYFYGTTGLENGPEHDHQLMNDDENNNSNNNNNNNNNIQNHEDFPEDLDDGHWYYVESQAILTKRMRRWKFDSHAKPRQQVDAFLESRAIFRFTTITHRWIKPPGVQCGSFELGVLLPTLATLQRDIATVAETCNRLPGERRIDGLSSVTQEAKALLDKCERLLEPASRDWLTRNEARRKHIWSEDQSRQLARHIDQLMILYDKSMDFIRSQWRPGDLEPDFEADFDFDIEPPEYSPIERDVYEQIEPDPTESPEYKVHKQLDGDVNDEECYEWS